MGAGGGGAVDGKGIATASAHMRTMQQMSAERHRERERERAREKHMQVDAISPAWEFAGIHRTLLDQVGLLSFLSTPSTAGVIADRNQQHLQIPLTWLERKAPASRGHGRTS